MINKGKTVLKKKVIKKEDDPAQENPQNKIIKGKTSLGKNKLRQKENKIPTKNNSQHLIDQIIITYYTHAWQKKIKAMMNRASSRPNKKAKDLRNIIRVLEHTISYHTYLYLMELLDIMSSLPIPKGVKHDPDYGKIFIVKNEGKEKEKEKENEENSTHVIEMDENDIVIEKPKTRLRENEINEKKNKKKKVDEDFDEELKYYYYRNDGKTLNRVEIEKDINRLIEEYPDKDIDVERILNSKRLQYKLKNPRFSPFTIPDNIDSFVRYIYTYKQQKKENENQTKGKKYKTYA